MEVRLFWCWRIYQSRTIILTWRGVRQSGPWRHRRDLLRNRLMLASQHQPLEPIRL